LADAGIRQFVKLAAVFGEQRKVSFAQLNDIFAGCSVQSVLRVT
jgi:hypothetical protein